MPEQFTGRANNFRQVQRHKPYYLNGGDLHFLVDSVQFRVHRHFSAPGKTLQGTSESNAIVLDDVTPEDFAKFLWVFYNPLYSLYDATIEEWGTIIKLAHKWDFPEVKKLVVRELEKMEMPVIDRLVLYQEFSIDEERLLPLYAILCAREEPLNLAESDRVGLRTAVLIHHARERVRTTSSDGIKSPLPEDVKDIQIQDTIRALMKAEAFAAKVPGGNQTSGSQKSKETTENTPNGSGSTGAKRTSSGVNGGVVGLFPNSGFARNNLNGTK